MILLDTNVVVDLLGSADHAEAAWSTRCYAAVETIEPLACNHVVLAEIAAGSHQRDYILGDLERLRIDVLQLTVEAAFVAGIAFADYRARGGRREAIIADFLIAGHAKALGATLMTRDRRVACYFPDLPLITPETNPHD